MQVLRVVSSGLEEDAESSVRRQQNRFSVLLVILRSRLTSEEYRILWRLHFCSRQLVRTRTLPGSLEGQWVQVVRRELDDMFDSLHRGEFSHAQLDRLVHVYGDLFLII